MYVCRERRSPYCLLGSSVFGHRVGGSRVWLWRDRLSGCWDCEVSLFPLRGNLRRPVGDGFNEASVSLAMAPVAVLQVTRLAEEGNARCHSDRYGVPPGHECGS